MQDLRWVGLDLLTQAASTRRYFCFLFQLAYNSEIYQNLYQNQISITMEPSIYSFSLCTALPLMLFFGFYFLFAKTPEKKIFKNYLRSRQIMGIAMLLLSANYSVHFFFGIRFKNVNSSIFLWFLQVF